MIATLMVIRFAVDGGSYGLKFVHSIIIVTDQQMLVNNGIYTSAIQLFTLIAFSPCSTWSNQWYFRPITNKFLYWLMLGPLMALNI